MVDPTQKTARTMMVGHVAALGRVELARFPDGRWTIRRNGPTLGVWPPGQQAECLRVFASLIGLDKPPDDRPNLVVVRRRHLTPGRAAPLN
jgi:hypothetical protein